MPLLRVKVNEAVVVAVPTDGCNIVGARIDGTRDDEEHADLSAWGGRYGQGEDDVHRIWMDAVPLQIGQVVEIELAASGDVVGEGVPFQSSPSDALPSAESLESELHALAQELRNQPWVREAYRFQYESTLNSPVACLMLEAEYGFGFTVLWNDLHPDRISVSLHAYTIDSVEHQESGRSLLEERLLVGQSCRLALVA